MGTLEIVLEEKFKSFHKGFKETLDGDLILLSGVNGSGKSHLLNILAGLPNPDGTRINGYVKINGNGIDGIEGQRIIYKNLNNLINSDRENVNFAPRSDPKYLKRIEDNAWAIYKQRNSGYYQEAQKVGVPHFDGRRYSIAVNKLYNLLCTFFPLSWNGDTSRFNHPVQENMLGYPTEDEFRAKFKTIDNIYEFWQPDDFFSERGIIDLFYNYAERRLNYIIKKYLKENKEERFSYNDLCKLFATNKDSQDRYLRNEGCQKAKEEFETKNPPPWELLNKQLSKLGFTYKFADDYEIHNSNIVGDVKLVDKDGSPIDFALGELSDGEFAIFSLALASLRYESLSGTLKILLLDEYDAILNPSLIEIFYEMLENFFIKKGVIVVIATHSTATISLAPKSTKKFKVSHYEINKPHSGLDRIINVTDYHFEEFRVAIENYYNSEDKKKILIDKCRSDIKDCLRTNKNILFVEGESDRIILLEAIKKLGINFNFEIIELDGADNATYMIPYIKKYLSTLNSKSKILFLLDADTKGYEVRGRLIPKNKRIKPSNGIYKLEDFNIYSLTLPVPSFRKQFIGGKISLLTIEHLFEDKFISDFWSYFKNVDIIDGVTLPLAIEDRKIDFAKLVKDIDQDGFKEFKLLFDLINTA